MKQTLLYVYKFVMEGRHTTLRIPQDAEHFATPTAKAEIANMETWFSPAQLRNIRR